MTKEERQIAAEDYAIGRGADKDKKAFRTITNLDLYDHTVQCFEAGAEAEAESKWISVEHRLPENNINTQYLVIVRDAVNGKKWYSVQRYYNDKWMGNFDNLCYVSHWQFITPLNQQ